MPALSKSRSSRRNLIPYLRSCSSKLSLTALSSTTSFTALFSSNNANNNSSRDLARSGGGTLNKCGDGHLSDVDESQAYVQGKENASPSKAANFATLPSSSTFKRLGGLSSSNSKSLSKSRSNFNLLRRSANSNANSVRGMGITISNPTLTPDSLAHMRSKFNLVPIANADDGPAFRGGDGGACRYGDLNGGSPSPSPSRNLNAGGSRLRETVEDDVVIISVESSRRLATGNTSGGGLRRTTTQSRVPVPRAPPSERPAMPQALRTRI